MSDKRRSFSERLWGKCSLLPYGNLLSHHTANESRTDLEVLDRFRTSGVVRFLADMDFMNDRDSKPFCELKRIADSELELRLKAAVKTEREILQEVLSFIGEVDRRRLYLDRSHPTLFSYLTKDIGYSPSAAMRRIDAARLLTAVPEMEGKLVSGDINLTQISEVTRAIRASENLNQRSVPKEIKAQLVQQVQNKDLFQTQQIVAKALEIPPRKTDHKRAQADSSVLLSVNLKQEQYKKLEDSRNRAAHKLRQQGRQDSWGDLIEMLAENFLKAYQLPKTSIPQKLIREVLERSDCCEFKNPSTGTKCGSKYQLQIDHIQPRWAGGSDEASNIRLLCAQHNQHRYAKQAGIKRI